MLAKQFIGHTAIIEFLNKNNDKSTLKLPFKLTLAFFLTTNA